MAVPSKKPKRFATTPDLEKRKQQLKATKASESDKEVIGHVEAFLSPTSKTTDKIYNALIFLDRIHAPLVRALRMLGKAVPLVDLALMTLTRIWDMFASTFISKDSVWLRASNVGLSLTVIAFCLVAIAVPAFAGIAFACMAGIELFRQARDNGVIALDWYAQHKELKTLRHQLLEAYDAHDQLEVERILYQIELVKHHQHEAGTQFINNGLSIAFATVALAGLIMMAIPPVFPIGLGLVIGTVAVATGTEIVKFTYNKFFAKPAISPERSKIEEDVKKHFAEKNKAEAAEDLAKLRSRFMQVTKTETYDKSTAPKPAPAKQAKEDEEGEGETEPPKFKL